MYTPKLLTVISLGLLLSVLTACRDVGDPDTFSVEAQELIDASFADLPGDTLVDHHVHVIGLGTNESGIEVNPDMQSGSHPLKYIRFKSFMDAAGIDADDSADWRYLETLTQQIRGFPVPLKVLGLALDRHYREDGSIDTNETEIFVPNAYVVETAERYPQYFIPAISIHPYRSDAVMELEKWAAGGVKVVKWVPNAQGIDPSSPRCDPFYAALKRLDMVLLSHAGFEGAIDSQGRQHLGNPLFLRRALDAGVKVIIAHCAIAGESVDLDDPDQRKVPNFDLFLRLMDTAGYEGLLFGDVSGMTLINQVGSALKQIMERRDLHHRLLYGSDYPLPAVSVLNVNPALVLLGYLDREILSALDEIQSKNPLLYNFVLMRQLRHPESGLGFSQEVFLNQLP